MEIGRPIGLKPGHTSTIRRIEGAMLSYHADADSRNNPFELGLDRLIDLDIADDFIGKTSLKKIKKSGIKKKQVGLVINCDPLPAPNNEFWPITKNNKKIGKITSAVFSPRLKKNIALGIIYIEFAQLGKSVNVEINGSSYACVQVELPFYDPKKTLVKQ